MKVSKVFGCVLGLHFGVIAVLLVQPGCQSRQPPTQTFTQESTMRSSAVGVSRNPASGVVRTSAAPTAMRSSVAGAKRTSGDLILATREATSAEPSLGLDAAFNAGFDGGDNFEEFANVAPIKPIVSQTTEVPVVEVAGSSFEAYTVKKGDSLWSISRRYNISLNELYAANGLNKNSVLRVGQQIQIPVEGGTATVRTVSADTYQPTSFDQATTSYTVARGDSLSKIASKFNTSVRAIKAANGKSSDLIRVGETLVIPVSGSSVSAPAPSFTPSSPVSSSGTHTVRAGEFPGSIARKYGMTSGELLALNGISDPRKLQVGQVLKVSGSGSAANVDSRVETVAAPTPVVSRSPAPVRSVAAKPVPTASSSGAPSAKPVEITVVEADPIIEGEVTEINTDDLFEGAVEIPVIRLEE